MFQRHLIASGDRLSLNRLQAKDPSISLEELYANQPNVLSLIEKYQKEATELGISLAGHQNRSTFLASSFSHNTR